MKTQQKPVIDDLRIWRKIQEKMTAEELGLSKAEWDAYCARMDKQLSSHHEKGSGKLVIYIDGAARGNPGPAAIGVVVKDGSNKVIREIHRRIGNATNNVAEYQALLAALDVAVELGGHELLIHTDSELLARQMDGRYRVKNAQLVELYQFAQEKLGHFDRCNIEHVPRQQNRRADQLANLALDTPE